MDDLSVDQRSGYLTTETFFQTFHCMNHTSLLFENAVCILQRLVVVDFVKISRLKLFLWSTLKSFKFIDLPLIDMNFKQSQFWTELDEDLSQIVACLPMLFKYSPHQYYLYCLQLSNTDHLHYLALSSLEVRALCARSQGVRWSHIALLLR